MKCVETRHLYVILATVLTLLAVVQQGIALEATDPFAIRLVDGSGPWEGRVEVYYRDQWGNVCDDRWTFNEARVVCRQLGFSAALKSYESDKFGRGTLPKLLKDTACQGTESRLQYCNGVWSVFSYYCAGAGVECSTDPANYIQARLTGGAVPWEGSVEILIRGQWYALCQFQWYLDNGRVVCRQLGYPSVVEVGTTSYSDPLYPGFLCTGDEPNLGVCNRGLEIKDCTELPEIDAEVVCQPPAQDSLGFIAFIAVIPVFICVCIVWRKRASKRNVNNTDNINARQPVQANITQPIDSEHISAPLELSSTNIPHWEPPSTDVLPSAPRWGEASSASNLPPPAYNTVMGDPSKFAFPPGQIAADGTTDLPITPPPEYVPQTVVFDTNTNSVNLTTSSTTLR